MNSSLYKCLVMHNRLEPVSHRFHYRIFMFYLDLDELPALARKLWFFGYNRFNIFNFRDKDHLQLPVENADKSKGIKRQILDYLRSQDVELEKGKIMLLTNLCTWGYQFNPVSFYYCFDENGELACAVVEVCNTYHEMKLYFLSKEQIKGDHIQLNTTKYFYVSPFIDMDTNFDFNLQIPKDKLHIKIDDYKEGRRFFLSTLTGEKRSLSNGNLLWFAIRFPFITIQIITLIHWNALKLWLKKLPFHRKKSNQNLQRDVLRPYPN